MRISASVSRLQHLRFMRMALGSIFKKGGFRDQGFGFRVAPTMLSRMGWAWWLGFGVAPGIRLRFGFRADRQRGRSRSSGCKTRVGGWGLRVEGFGFGF